MYSIKELHLDRTGLEEAVKLYCSFISIFTKQAIVVVERECVEVHVIV